MGHFEDENDSGVITEKRSKVKKPSLYKVLLHNDDYTTMEFVIYILKGIFNKTQEEAEDIMLSVHNNGVGVCGIYTFEIAETKCEKVLREGRADNQPLQCTIERE